LLHLPCGNKADITARKILGPAFRQNFDNVSPGSIMNSWCDIGATWRRPRNWRNSDPIFVYLP
jgi:hypothetical protein